jgi:hypothetical protein
LFQGKKRGRNTHHKGLVETLQSLIELNEDHLPVWLTDANRRIKNVIDGALDIGRWREFYERLTGEPSTIVLDVSPPAKDAALATASVAQAEKAAEQACKVAEASQPTEEPIAVSPTSGADDLRLMNESKAAKSHRRGAKNKTVTKEESIGTVLPGSESGETDNAYTTLYPLPVESGGRLQASA